MSNIKSIIKYSLLSIAGSAAIGGLYYYFSKTYEPNSQTQKIEISKDTLISMIKEIYDNVSIFKGQLLAVKKGLQAQNIPSEDINNFLLSQLKDHMQLVEHEVHNKYFNSFSTDNNDPISNTDIDTALESAQLKYQDDEDLQDALNLFSNLTTEIINDNSTNNTVPASLTATKLISLLRELMSSMNEILASTVKEVADNKDNVNNSPEETNKLLLTLYAQRMAEHKYKILSDNNFTENDINAGMIQYGNDPNFLSELQAISKEQEETLTKIREQLYSSLTLSEDNYAEKTDTSPSDQEVKTIDNINVTNDNNGDKEAMPMTDSITASTILVSQADKKKDNEVDIEKESEIVKDSSQNTENNTSEDVNNEKALP